MIEWIDFIPFELLPVILGLLFLLLEPLFNIADALGICNIF